MTRHDVQLWEYAAKELELGDHRYVERHLEDCPECVEQLAAVAVAQEALALAREATPRFDWTRTDQRLGALVERRLAAKARGPWLARLVLGSALAAALVALALWPSRPVPLPPPPVAELPEPGAPVATWARVDSAEGLTRVGEGEVAGGTELRAGDVLRTSLAGRAFVHLPDESHVRVGGGTQVAMTRTERDDIALTLERGRVAVRASHRERQGFAVHSGGVTVHVVGTTFGVAREADAIEVAVKEGRVRVELASGDVVLVSPGERLRVEARSGRVRRLKLTPSLQRELREVADLAETTSSVEQRAVVPAAGGAGPSRPPMLTAQGAPRSLPRLSAEEAKARLGTPPEGLAPEELAPLPSEAATTVEVTPPPKPEARPAPAIVLEAPEDVWPSLGGGEIIRGVPPKREQAPASQPEEWRGPPAPDADEWAALPAAASARGDGARSPAAGAPGAPPAPAASTSMPATSTVVAAPSAPLAPARPASGQLPPAPATGSPLARAAPVPSAAALPTPASAPAASAQPAPGPSATVAAGAAPPAPAPAVDSPASPSRLAPGDLEAQFLRRAQAAVDQASCERFLPGLEDIALDTPRGERTEQARVLRARCYDGQLRPRQAMREYRAYLEEYPSGRFVGEARQALGE